MNSWKLTLPSGKEGVKREVLFVKEHALTSIGVKCLEDVFGKSRGISLGEEAGVNLAKFLIVVNERRGVLQSIEVREA